MRKAPAPAPASARRSRRRYSSDTTAAEWALIEPLLPPPACQTRQGGRPEKHHRHDIVDAIRILDQLRARIRGGRSYCPNPVAIILDSQTVRAAETVSNQTRAGTTRNAPTAASVTWPVTWAAYR